MKELKSPVAEALLLVVLVILFFYLGYDGIFFRGPYGIHFMRQTDSLSFASQYYNHGFHFFQPQLFNLKNLDGRAACEFPLMYYLTALIYTLTGKKYFVLRLLHLLIVYGGVIYVFKLMNLLLKDRLYAFLGALVFFTSAVFNYYAFNYLPDVAALGFTFAGWYYVLKYMEDGRRKMSRTGFLFFLLAGLIKVTYFINPLAFLAYVFVEWFSMRKKEGKKIAYGEVFWDGVVAAFLVLAWNLYVLHYNAVNHATSFNTTALPVWDLTWKKAGVVWDYIYHYWFEDYFSKPVFYLLGVLIVLQVIFFKRSQRTPALVTLFQVLGSLAYFILFYRQFKDHDYYFLAFFPLVTLLLLNGLHTLQGITKNKIFHLTVQAALAVIVVTGINHARGRLHRRLMRGPDDYSVAGLTVEKNLPAIEKLGIPADAKVIVAPDRCQDGGLFFLNRMGWNLRKEEDITPEAIASLKQEGAGYLFLVSDKAELLETAKGAGTLIFRGKGLSLFRLETGNAEKQENR